MIDRDIPWDSYIKKRAFSDNSHMPHSSHKDPTVRIRNVERRELQLGLKYICYGMTFLNWISLDLRSTRRCTVPEAAPEEPPRVSLVVSAEVVPKDSPTALRGFFLASTSLTQYTRLPIYLSKV